MTKPYDYENVYNYLQDLVHNHLSENEKIPSENQLCETFRTTRSTVRQGIAKLKNEGLIYSKKGSGYLSIIRKFPIVSQRTLHSHKKFSKLAKPRL